MRGHNICLNTKKDKLSPYYPQKFTLSGVLQLVVVIAIMMKRFVTDVLLVNSMYKILSSF